MTGCSPAGKVIAATPEAPVIEKVLTKVCCGPVRRHGLQRVGTLCYTPPASSKPITVQSAQRWHYRQRVRPGPTC